jgi:hypothetical protein
MQIAVIGLDLAKNDFQVHGIDDSGQAVLKRKLRRSEVLPFGPRQDPAARLAVRTRKCTLCPVHKNKDGIQ